jgi:hypothetical protein
MRRAARAGPYSRVPPKPRGRAPRGSSGLPKDFGVGGARSATHLHTYTGQTNKQHHIFCIDSRRAMHARARRARRSGPVPPPSFGCPFGTELPGQAARASALSCSSPRPRRRFDE